MDETGTLNAAEEPKWFAVQVRASREKLTSVNLRNRGVEQFVPFYTEQRRWSDRWKAMEVPLFPGYVFCRFDPAKRLSILDTPGVMSIVGYGKGPVAIAPGEIEGLRAVVGSCFPVEPWPYLCEGSRVMVTAGCLRGVEGTLLKVRGNSRVVLSVTLLERSISVEIDDDLLVPVRESCQVAPFSRRRPQVR